MGIYSLKGEHQAPPHAPPPLQPPPPRVWGRGEAGAPLPRPPAHSRLGVWVESPNWAQFGPIPFQLYLII